MELEPSTFEVSEALSNAMTLVRERAQRHGILLGQQVDPKLGEIAQTTVVDAKHRDLGIAHHSRR